MMSYPKVSIIILNWNGWKDTIECLESLYQITYPNYDVIIIDNGSEDESIEKIKEYCEGKIKVTSKFFEYDTSNKPIKIIEYTRQETEAGGGKEKEIADLPPNRKLILIKNEKNYGFTEGNNIGMRYAMKALNPDYILLLNNDTVVDKRFLDELIKIGGSDEKIGIVGPITYLYKKSDVVQETGGKMSMWSGRRKHVIKTNNNKTEVDFVSGVCLLIKEEVAKKVGLLDKEYFAYIEDIEWCTRVRKQGYSILSVSSSYIWHKGSASTGGKYSPTVLYYITRNNFLFIKKYTKLYHLPSFLIISGYYFTKRLAISFIENPEKAKSMIKGMIKGLLSIFKNID